MNTEDFIRHHARKILAETRERRKIGGISRAAREVLGLADSDPKTLLSRLGIPSNKKIELKDVVELFAKNAAVAQAFEDPSFPSASAAEVYIRVLPASSDGSDGSDGLSLRDRCAVSPFQAPRYLKAAITAAKKAGVLDIDLAKVEYQVFEEDGEKFLVRVLVG
jgi:hypothetical protein